MFTGKLPTDRNNTAFRYDPFEYYYCYKPSSDTIDHIFMNGYFTKNLWKYF